MAKLSVIGLDGVNHTVLEHAIEKGLMPNLKELKDRGCFTELETTYPPVTGPAWTSIMTGVNPGRHNIYDFLDHLTGKPYSSKDIESETVYEKIAKRGEVTLINLPLSYPPNFEGEFVGSFLAPEDDFVRPKELKKEFDFSRYKKSISAREKSTNVIDSSISAAEDKKDLMDELLGEQDMFFMLFSATDWIMHNHYHKMEDGKPEKAFKIFKIIDESIGAVRERSENIILLSDHGFQNFEKTFHVNQFLKDIGCLETKGSMGSMWTDSTTVDLFLDVVTGFGPLKKAVRKTYLLLQGHLPLPENVKVRLGTALSDGIDMENTKAFCPSSGIRGIYINDQRFEGAADESFEIRKDILEKLPEYTNPLKGEEVFSGHFAGKAPDIIFEEQEHRITRSIYGKQESDLAVNHHGRRGFFLAEGENFSEEDLDLVSLYDVAPTIASLFGLAMDADGETLPIVNKEIRLTSEDIPRDF